MVENIQRLVDNNEVQTVSIDKNGLLDPNLLDKSTKNLFKELG